MSSRRRAREIVLQLLYLKDLNHEQKLDIMDRFLCGRLHHRGAVVQFGRDLLKGTLENRKKIDEALSSTATNWAVKRMASIDRNILRLGTFELLMTETPRQVVINEAIELAKRYGDRNSGSFVNGVLDKVAAAHQPRVVSQALNSHLANSLT